MLASWLLAPVQEGRAVSGGSLPRPRFSVRGAICADGRPGRRRVAHRSLMLWGGLRAASWRLRRQ
eukprot:8426683-Alexandrium_andersonii.AAC.1